MTVKNTQQTLSTTLEKTEQSLNGLETALENNVGGRLRATIAELPMEWVSTKFTEVLDVQGGTQPPKSEFIFEPSEGYIRLLQIRDFGKKPIPNFVPVTTKLKTCEKADVLIGRYGASLGRICTGMEGAYNVALAKVLTFGDIEGKYLKHFLNSENFQMPLRLLSRSAQNGFNKNDLATFDFPLPPLAEQTIIAQTLDTLLAQVDNIKTRLDAIPKILKTFRQSVLAAAVSGKLTEEWRGENECESAESYSMAVNALRVEKHNELQTLANRKSKYKNALEPIDNVITHTPINWKVFSLDEVTCRITYGLTVRPAYVDEGVPIISAKEIKTGLVDYHGAKKFDDSLFEAQREKCKIFLNDVLFSKTGSIGHVARVTEDRPLCSSQNIAVLSPLINSRYLELVMRSPYVQELASGSVKANAIPDLQLGVMARFPIPCPFELEQTEIVRRVEELFAFADQIEQQVKNAQGRVNNLTQSILAKAFRGELTTQWRAENPDLITGDNSAEALLAKIQEEREKLKPKKAAKKKTTAKKTTQKK